MAMASASLPPADPIQQLPQELQASIFSHVDYHGLIRLSRASHYYHDHYAINPQDRTAVEKIAFVKTAQLWKRHNQVIRHVTYMDVPKPILQTVTSGYACYGCYKVRPVHAFAVRQIREKYKKSDPKEGTPGHERHCIDCSIAAGLYRRNVQVNVPRNDVLVFRAFGGPKPELTSARMFFCQTCNALKSFGIFEDRQNCADCGALSRKDQANDIFYEAGVRLYACKQCSKVNASEPDSMCSFCPRPICDTCGWNLLHGCEPTWDPWSGRDCSQSGYEYCWHFNEPEQRFGSRLARIIKEKRMVRGCEKVAGMLEGTVEEGNCLSLLFQ